MQPVALAFALSVSVASSAPGEALLDICKSAYESFEPKAAVKSCAAAADVKELPLSDRIDALRLLAQAHLLANEDSQATLAFARMLVLDDDLLLPREAGPRERDVFARARAKIERDGRILATHDVDADGRLQASVTDPMRRVAAARVRSRVGNRIHVAPLRSSRAGDLLTLTGVVPKLSREATVQFEILLDGHTGTTLAVDAPLRGTLRGAAPEAGAAPASSAQHSIGWAIASTGVGLGVLTVGIGSTTAIISGYPIESWGPLAAVAALGCGGITVLGAALVWTAEPEDTSRLAASNANENQEIP